MMATVCHVTSSLELRKFQADGFLFDSVQPCQAANIKRTGKCSREYTKNSVKEMNLSRKLEILMIHTHQFFAHKYLNSHIFPI